MDKLEPTAEERRRYYRISPQAEVTCRIEGMEVVHLVGLGANGAGMRLITDKELPSEGSFPVILATGSGPILTLKGRVAWRDTWDFDFCSRHVAGIEFVDLGEEERSHLTGLLPPPEERSEAPLTP
jgi:hypothetical protein